ncbi:MAG: hypothetical protein ISR20_03965 [Candidatus Poseidonia sp.]|nr:hypothetical protein [Poseidonia sp.]
MFTGTVEARSHEGGLLVHFDGSSPALNAIVILAEDGTYIGKVDGVIGNTNHPLAHIGHVDRKLDLDTVMGAQVGIRAKKARPERERSNDRDDSPRRDDRRDNHRSDRNNSGRERGSFSRQDRGGQRGNHSDNHGDNDWDCPKCNNSNFARRTVCNLCEEPRPGGTGGGQRHGRRNDFQRRDRNSGGGRETFNDNDWTCPECKNSNFSFRQQCNRCEAPRPGGGGGRSNSGPSSGGYRDRNGGGGRDRGSSDRDGGGGYRDRNGGGGRDRGSSDRGGGGGYRDRNGGGGRDRGSSDRGGGGGYRDRNGGGGRDRGSSDRGGGGGYRDRNGGGGRDRGSSDRGGGDRRGGDRSSDYRKAKGKRSGHAHNRPPRDLFPRKFERQDED